MSTSATSARTTGGRAGKGAPKRLNAGQGRLGLLLVSPTLLLLGVVILYPLVKAVILSFTKDSGLDPATGMFSDGGAAGFSNYTGWLLQRCGDNACPPGTLKSQTYSALGITLFWTVASVAIETVLGLWFATIMNRTFRGRSLVRAAILVPWAIPTAVTAKLFYFMFATDGVINHLLGYLHIGPILWFGEEWPSRWAVLISDVWKTAPFMALLILAGLQVIPADVYEAAQIDGASRWQTFTRITLPLVRTPLMVAVLFRALDVLRIYDLPAIMTGGANGTTSLSILVVKQIRSGFHSASALSTLIFLLIALVAFLFIRFGGADVVQRAPKRTSRRTRRPKDPGQGTGTPTTAPAAPAGAAATTPGGNQ